MNRSELLERARRDVPEIAVEDVRRLVDQAADLVLLDPKAAWTPTAADLLSKSGNNPLVGRALTGRVRATFVGGRQVFGA